jgi:hypothetical protein
LVYSTWLGFGPGINLAKYSKIGIGMTYQEVDTLLGGDGEDPAINASVTWYDHPDGLTIVVYFDEHGRAASKHLIPPEPLRTLRNYCPR